MPLPEKYTVKNTQLLHNSWVFLFILIYDLIYFTSYRSCPCSLAIALASEADGETVERCALCNYEGGTYESRGYTLTVAVENGAVRVSESDCPNQDCVHSGAISRAGQSIVCLPARVAVTLEGAASDYDLIAG